MGSLKSHSPGIFTTKLGPIKSSLGTASAPILVKVATLDTFWEMIDLA